MNLELTYRCGICRCFLDAEELFCANCGTENPFADQSSKRLENTASHHSFDCQSCGASMSYDASAQALRCPFCGSTKMEKREAVRSVKPEGIIGMQISRQAAEATLRKWLTSSFWRPGDAARSSRISEMTAVYVPYWVFEASTDTLWTADSSPAPAGSRGDWYPVSGHNSSDYSGILVGGSSVLTAAEIEAISPYDLRSVVTADQVDLTNVVVEEFRVPRKLARPAAREQLRRRETAACSRRVPGRVRNVRINMQISSMCGHPLLLPVWILAYQYRNDVHRVLINGQNGKIAGSAPFSYGKLFLVGAIMLLVFVALLAVAALSSQM